MLARFKSLKQHQGFIKYFKNTSWLLAEKILRIITGLFIGIWVARYLGPEQFGIYSYAQSFVSLFAVIATFGLDGIVVREILKDERKIGEIIGSSFYLKLFGAFLVLMFLAVAVNFTSNDNQTNLLVFIIASSTIFQSFNVVDFYFQAKVKSKYIVKANIISLFISSVVKIILILYEAPLVAFAWVVLFDSIILAIGFIYFFYRKSDFKIKKLILKQKVVISLMKDSWPLILSAIIVTAYMKRDIIMLKEFLGEYEVGMYSASTRISEAWYFIPVLVTSSLFPGILNAKKIDKITYENRLRNLYKVLVWMAVVVSIVLTFIADNLMLLLFGQEYVASADILMIQIWSGIFISFLMVSNKWLLAENKTRFIFIRGLFGVIINIILNYIFIPIYGVNAAAFTSLITLIFTSLIIDVFTKDTRRHLHIKLCVFNPKLMKFEI